MKTLAVTIPILMAALLLQAQTPPMVPPNSSEWGDIYDPPYKVPTELPADSKLRRDLFDLLRTKGTPQYRFSGSLKVFRNWALFIGATVDKNGSPITHPPHDNTDSVALWLRTSEGWRLIDFSFGHSDAFHLVWSEKYGVPAVLVGLNQESEAESGPRE